jgi:hypothetical protein
MLSMLDPVEFGKAMAAIVNEATAPLVKRIEELEARQRENGDPALPVEIDVSDVVKELLASDGIKQLVGLEVESFLTENPPPAGKDGEPGKDGAPGEPGKSVTLDDVSVFLEAAVAKHVLDFERRASEKLDKAIERIPVPKDGRDGVDLTELSVDFDGERTVTVKGRTGTVTKRVPIPLWRGYWSPDVVAEKSDILTHNGTAYIAIVDNPKCEPGVGKYDHEWKVFARKGRDGRDGRNGIDKTAPVKVKREDE